MTKNNNIKATVLGCGSSGGVPLIGNIWGPCDPNEKKNYRSRVSMLVNIDNKYNVLIDTSPDLRNQMLNAHIKSVDCVLYTHAHADHVHGIDDLRAFCWQRKTPLPIYGDKSTINQITNRFEYAFNSDGKPALPSLKANIIDLGENKILDNIKFKAIKQIHGKGYSTGYRFNNFAYSTDLKKFYNNDIDKLLNLDLWIVGLLRYDKHSSHASLSEILELIDYLKPKKTILTHMTALLDEKELIQLCPENVIPGYDGMIINI